MPQAAGPAPQAWLGYHLPARVRLRARGRDPQRDTGKLAPASAGPLCSPRAHLPYHLKCTRKKCSISVTVPKLSAPSLACSQACSLPGKNSSHFWVLENQAHPNCKGASQGHQQDSISKTQTSGPIPRLPVPNSLAWPHPTHQRASAIQDLCCPLLRPLLCSRSRSPCRGAMGRHRGWPSAIHESLTGHSWRYSLHRGRQAWTACQTQP